MISYKKMTKKVKGMLIKAVILIILLTFPAAIGGFFLKYYGRIYPGVYVGDVEVGGLKPQAGIEKFKTAAEGAQKIKIEIRGGEDLKSFDFSFDLIGLKYDFEKTMNNAYMIGRGGNWLGDIKTIARLLRKPVVVGAEIDYEEDKLEEVILAIDEQVSIKAVGPAVSLEKGKGVVNKGTIGKELDKEELKAALLTKLVLLDWTNVEIDLKVVDTTIDDGQAEELKARAEKFINKSLVSKFEYQEFWDDDEELVLLINPYGGYKTEEIGVVVEEIAEKVNREPQNPTFVFSGGRVKEFTAAKDGVAVNEDDLRGKVREGLVELETTEADEVVIEIAVARKAPEFETADVNDMGIKQLIGRGTSRFRGSAASRVYNLSLAASRLSGVLVKPGEMFSFNREVGEVSKETGYKEAYIIKEDKTILDDGGGVCQVSTTLFRAVLNAGLPIYERQAHAYRVYYYEQDSPVGLDATVYSPTTDFKFKNDTEGHILIQSQADTKNSRLIFELYGTDDGRVATITKPILTDQTPPPDDVYIDEPTLAAGEIKQTEHKAWGAKVKFSYMVTRGEETIYQKTFYSNYKPWGNVFLRGTGTGI